MRFIFAKCLIFILLFSGENIVAQNIKAENYEIIVIDTDCRSGFYLSNYFDIVNPFSPNGKNSEIVFGVPDSSNIKIRIFNAADNNTIFKFEQIIGNGCYKLNWISQNIEKLKSGTYFCSLEAHQRNQKVVSDFNAIQKIIFIK